MTELLKITPEALVLNGEHLHTKAMLRLDAGAVTLPYMLATPFKFNVTVNPAVEFSVGSYKLGVYTGQLNPPLPTYTAGTTTVGVR